MLKNYLKIALRNLLRNKVYSFINILGLAIGVCACLVIFLLVSFELSFDNFHPDRERIYRITSGFKNPDGSPYYNAGLSAPMPFAVREEVTGLEKIAAFRIFYPKVTILNFTKNLRNAPQKHKKDNSEVIICEPEFFQIFQYEWLQGNPKTALKTPNEVVLTISEAESYFGKIAPQLILGRQLYFNDSLITTVTGIVKDLPQNTDIKFKNFISFKSIASKSWRKEFQLDEWTNTNGDSQAFVKLSEGTSAESVNTQLVKFLKKHLDPKDEWSVGRSLTLQPLTDIHFNANFGDSFSRQVHLPTLYALMGIAIFLLLIAAINFINLATAQSITRVKEIGVRKVLGSSRKSLIFQFMCETFVITFTAVLLSILFVDPILWVFADFLPKELSFNIFEPKIIGFLISITFITSVLSGLYPAWVISSYTPVASLKNQVSNGQTRTAFLRKALITFQFTASQVFILGTIIVATQSKFMLNKNMGFKKDAIVYFQTDWKDTESNKKQILINKLRQFPEIETVCLGDPPAREGYSTTALKFFDGKKEITTTVHQKSVDEFYVKTFGLKIIAGRDLSPSDTLKEFLINEAYTKELGFKKPEQAVGKFINYYSSDGKPMKFPIKGVLANFHFQSMHNEIKPLYMSANKYANSINVKIRSNGKSSENFKSVLTKMEKAYSQVYPDNDQVFQPIFFDETFANFYKKEQQFARILNTATGIAIFISCMGLFGLVAFTTQRRTKEIGIRKVLGASVTQIVQLLSKDFLRLVILGIVIASPIAYWAMNKWLQDFAYRVEISWWIFALAGVVAVVIALLTVSYQSIRAAMANPVKSLRTE
jgi:putative ABC transport system permease protein